MKAKFSISLFALLFVVLTLVTSFTKEHQTKYFGIYAVWGIRPITVSSQYFPPVNFNVLSCSIQEGLYLSLSSIASMGYSNLDEFKDEYDNGGITCSSDPGYVCLAYVKYDIGNPTNGIVLDIIDGDYSHE